MGDPFRFRNQPRGGKLPTPPAVAIDRFGKMIEPGHLILFNSPEDLAFEVVDVTTAMEPTMPGQRLMKVMLQAQFPVTIMAAQPNRGMVIVGETQARLQARAAQNGQGTTHVVEAEEPPASGIVLTDLPRANPDAVQPRADDAPVVERAGIEAAEDQPKAVCGQCGSHPCACF